MGTVTEQSVMAVIRSARPAFRNAHDKVAFAIHAAFVASGLVLHATGPPAFTDDALSSSSAEEVGTEHWNEFDDNYAFVYSNPEKGSTKILVKCLVMNGKLLVDALREGDSEPAHLEINVEDYVVENAGNNYTSIFKNFGKLVREVDRVILAKYAGPSKSSSSSRKSSLESRGGQEYNPYQPGFSEPDTSTFNPPPPGYAVPPVPGIGGDDLFPGAGAGVYPTRGDFGGSGGMLVGPHDPRFFGGIGREPHIPGGLPQGVPPGARFDPYGPPGVPGFEPNRFVRNPRGRGGGIHPDLQHFRDGSDNDII